MSAAVLPFPVTRRRCDIQGIAANMLGMRHSRAEAYLRSFCKRLAADLRGKQVAADLIDAEIASFEASVRAALWRSIYQHGGAA